MLTTSRDSGAGAYSQGTAWPSPRPHVAGAAAPRPTSLERSRRATAADAAFRRRVVVSAMTTAYIGGASARHHPRMAAILGRVAGITTEDPFGPGDPLEVARLVRRALAAAGRK